jgi:hypothetical protein
VYEIDELVLGMTEDFDTTSTRHARSARRRGVQIHEDGTITPYP